MSIVALEMKPTSPEQRRFSRPRRWLIQLQGKLWPVPALLAFLGALLGVLVPLLDARLELAMLQTSASGARAVLSAAAGSLATVLGVTFSVTVVTLQLAATQYSSRILRRFMADRMTQLLLGLFLGSVVYLFVVLRTVRSEAQDFGEFIPDLALLLGLLLTIGCLSLLAYFVHHLVRSIQVATIVMGIAKETKRTILGMEAIWGLPSAIEPSEPDSAAILRSPTEGYIQGIVLEDLLEAASKSHRRLRLNVELGDFVLKGSPLLTYWPASKNEDLHPKDLGRSILVGRERTPNQDVLFGIRQVVDIALKALSPGINDVTTAVMALNELGAITLDAAREGLRPYRTLHDCRQGGTQLLIPSYGLDELLHHAFSEIALAASGLPRVLSRMMELLEQQASLLDDQPQRDSLYRTGQRIHDLARRSHSDPASLNEIERGWHRLARVAHGQHPSEVLSPMRH